MPTGRCKLCLREDRDLKESHLMPAGMYRRIRSDEKNPHPIMITKDGSRPSSMQVTDYVLCGECESRFDAFGENYTLRFAAGNGRFRLLEELETAQPSFSRPEWRGYNAVDSPGIKREHLAYFGSVFFGGRLFISGRPWTAKANCLELISEKITTNNCDYICTAGLRCRQR